MKNLVLNTLIVKGKDYHICLNPNCDTIYYSEEVQYKKHDLQVKVWFKESSPVTVCYCTEVTDEDILTHIVKHKCCKDMGDIKKHTGANSGDECLVKNPTGK
nr:(2Fe-2S)-binding protein [Candidatus Contubernalis alkalaceticus]